jgi:hypothetical protein
MPSPGSVGAIASLQPVAHELLVLAVDVLEVVPVAVDVSPTCETMMPSLSGWPGARCTFTRIARPTN